jgi:prepilin-type N-terminal cleavage/methylation domain-containing protein
MLNFTIKIIRKFFFFRNKAGFTFIEIMVTVALIVILSGLTLPPLLRWRTNAQLRGAASNLKGDLELVKMRAIRENTFVAIKFTDDGYVAFVDNGGSTLGNFEEDAGEARVVVRRLPGSVKILLPTAFDQNRTHFAGRGLPENTGAVVLLGRNGEQKQISVNRMGRIILQ